MDTNARTAVLEVGGMTCDDCADHVTAALEGAGAEDVSVAWRAGEARFSWPGAVAEGALRAAVQGAGYRPGTLRLLGTGVPKEAADGSLDYDLVVVGAGSAAFAAAIKAAEAGYSVALVEHGILGGTCVNVGCVPSKALLRAGELAWTAGHHPFAGLSVTSGPVDLRALVTQKDQLVGDLRQKKYADLVDDYGFAVIEGHGRFSGPEAFEVDGRRLRAAVYLVATGASPAAPPIPGLAEAGYLTSTSALELTEVPRRLVVIGANAIGLELGQFFIHIGAEVTFVDVAERIAPFEEPEISEALTSVLTAQGAAIHAGAHVLGVKRGKDHVEVTASVGGRQLVLVGDEVLVATGRRPNTEGLGLEAAGVTLDGRGALMVDEELRTANPRIFGAGDVTGAPQFVYVSAYEGALAVDNALLGAGRKLDFTGLPRVTFTAPQVASAGLTAAQAAGAGYGVETSVLPLSAVPRALVNHDTAGLVKLVAEAGTGRLLGASVLAEGAGDVIQTAVLAIRHGVTAAELAATFHPYLTMVEGLKLAAQTFTRDVEKLSCCAA
ncbi:MAG TPA: mercury(II) reductase [Acidimicrobiales bacterium]|nr:mercury(II) reductase [Acidimicrobiales bacterium]